MLTDLSRTNIHDRRVASASTLKTYFLEFLEGGIKRIVKAMTTGPTPTADVGAFFQKVTMADGAGGATITLGACHGTDGQGNQISVAAADGRITDVPFQNSGGVTYYVGIMTADRPVGVSQDTVSGQCHYDRHLQECGHVAAPSAVVVNGSTLEFTIQNHINAANDYTGRTAICYLVSPVSPNAAVAIESVTISGTVATTTGFLGQSTPSTDASDYLILITGPRISRTSIVATTGLAFVGTTVGAATPRTYDTSSQTLINTLAGLSNTFSSLIDRGWVTYPAVTVGASTVTVTGTGTLYLAGRFVTTPTSSALTFGATAESWVYYDSTSHTFKSTATQATAFASTATPLLYVKTVGGSVTYTGKAYPNISKFNKNWHFMVSNESSVYPGAFTSIKDALTAARSVYLTAGIQPSITIEVLSYTTFSAKIDQAELLGIPNVTIKGRSSGFGQPPAAVDNDTVSRILWDFAGPLFDVATGSTLRGWTFQDIHFQPQFTGTGDTDAIVQVTGTGTLADIAFVRCHVDGINVYNTTAARLGHIIYATTTTAISGVTFRDCQILIADAIFYATAATVSNLNVVGNQIANTAVAAITTTAKGGFFFVATGTHSQIVMDRNNYTGNGGFLNLVGAVSSVWIHDNHIQSDTGGTDECLIRLGEAAGVQQAHTVYIHDNYLNQKSTGTPTAPVILVYAGNQSAAGGVTGIFIHDNHIRSEADTSGVGINVTGDGADCVGLNIHDNDIAMVNVGIFVQSAWRNVVVANNSIWAGTVGIDFEGNVTNSVISGNAIIIDNNTSTGIFVDDSCTQIAITGNVVGQDSGATMTHGINHRGAQSVITGNWTPAPITINDSVVVGGNIAKQVVVDDTGDSVIVGNLLTGAAVAGIDLVGDTCVIVGNFTVGSIDVVEDHLIVVGNRIGTMDVLGGTAQVFVGNRVVASTGTLDIDAATSVIVGNILANNSDLLGSDVVFSGNYVSGQLNSTNTASTQLAIVGNYIGSTLSLAGDRGTFVGNYCNAALTLEASSSDYAVAANRFDAALVNNGSGHTTTGANDT